MDGTEHPVVTTAWGKGWAIERAATTLKRHGIANFAINASGGNEDEVICLGVGAECADMIFDFDNECRGNRRRALA